MAVTARLVRPNFITEIIDRDLGGELSGVVRTRFPPEPNGYPHIGHAKSICLNFGLALDYRGECNLRFDDTNPETESQEYVEAFLRDLDWLGFAPSRVRFASDYFDQMYLCAAELIRQGAAYVDSVGEEEMRRLRGTVTVLGSPSPFRDRSVAENLALFADMAAGRFGDGEHVLRAKIDLGSPNFKLRDPVLYRIVHATHYRTGDRWCIYPMYDFAHPLEDLIEGVTHSLCTLEFENNRAVYDWLVERLRGRCGLPERRPRQYEFARLSMDYTVMSKRKLLRLVQEGEVQGWDDPRMPTLSGLRRRGVRPEAVRSFADRVGVDRANSRVELSLLDAVIRDDLNAEAPRVMAVLRPVKLVLSNLPASSEVPVQAPYWPRDVPRQGSRTLPLGRELWIEADDFSEDPPKGFRRLRLGGRVRLRYAYVIEAERAVKDASGRVLEIHARVLPETLGSDPADGVRPQGVIHWVPVREALPAEFRLYDRLFAVPDPDAADDPATALNPSSRAVAQGYIEPSVQGDAPDQRYQFERLGYFWPDPEDSRPDRRIYNRIVPLKDSYRPGPGRI